MPKPHKSTHGTTLLPKHVVRHTTPPVILCEIPHLSANQSKNSLKSSRVILPILLNDFQNQELIREWIANYEKEQVTKAVHHPKQ